MSDLFPKHFPKYITDALKEVKSDGYYRACIVNACNDGKLKYSLIKQVVDHPAVVPEIKALYAALKAELEALETMPPSFVGDDNEADSMLALMNFPESDRNETFEPAPLKEFIEELLAVKRLPAAARKLANQFAEDHLSE